MVLGALAALVASAGCERSAPRQQPPRGAPAPAPAPSAPTPPEPAAPFGQPAEQPPPVPEQARAWDESQRKLEESLARLEALRREAESGGASAGKPPPTDIAVREPPSEPVAAPLAARQPDAGAERAEAWAKVRALADEDRLAEALDAAGKAWSAGGHALSAEGAAALQRVSSGMRRRAGVPCDPSCSAQAEALERLPETDPVGRRLAAELWVSLSSRALAAGDARLARRHARRALQLEEVLAPAFAALARAAYAENEFDDAESLWDRAIRASSAPLELKAYRQALEGLQKERASFGRGRKASEHFAVTYDPARDEEAARLALELLELARREVGAIFEVYPEGLLTVVLYSDDSFDKVKHTSWAAGFFDGKVRMPTGGAVANPLRFKATLFHEYAHGLFRRATGNRGDGPGWLNEGLASIAGNLAAPRPLGGCKNGHAFPLKSLEPGFGGYERVKAPPAYLEARHAAERLRETFGEARVRELLREVGRAKSFDAAFDRTLGVSYSRWAEQFDGESGH